MGEEDLVFFQEHQGLSIHFQAVFARKTEPLSLISDLCFRLRTFSIKQMNRILYACLIAGFSFLLACSGGIKEKINQTGEAAGEAIGEFGSGVGNGMEKSIEPKVEFDAALREKGLDFGKMKIGSDTLGEDHVLLAYLIFDQDFSGTVVAKAFDAGKKEMGRVRLQVAGKKGDARFVEFPFETHTELQNNSLIRLEPGQ